MNAFHKYLVVAGLALTALPALSAAVESPPPPQPQAQDLEKRLADARRRLDEAAREVGELSGQLGRGFAYQLQTQGGGPPPRALLGIGVGYDQGKDGAHLFDVSPGGAAAEAGIKVGDVITSIAGQDLTKENDPGRALVDRMRQVEPNLKVQVGVLRDGKKLSFDVTPRPAPPTMMGQVQRLPAGPGGGVIQLQPGSGGVGMPGGLGQRRIEIRTMSDGSDDGTRFRGMEFATLSAKLGSYFGVKSGVLVVRAGASSPFKLQDGDVILAIDGREPTSAQHAGRILRSYRDGEKLKLRVQRDRKAEDIEVTMPTGGREDDHDD